MELPQYSVQPGIGRILIQQFFKLIILCALFYGGVWVNFFLLGADFPLWITITVIAILAVLLVAQMFITKFRAGKYHYDFFQNRVEFYGEKLKSVLFSNVRSVKTSRNIFDILAGTATIALSKDFKISGLKNYLEIQNYLNQLIQNYTSYMAQQFSQSISAAANLKFLLLARC